jgi:hypothetical protein
MGISKKTTGTEIETEMEVKVESFKNPEIGLVGEALYTNAALLGPSKAITILVLGSRTHGSRSLLANQILNPTQGSRYFWETNGTG